MARRWLGSFLFGALISNAYTLHAAGLTLLESPSARASALGEAFTAANNDVSAQTYNPASLATLAFPQASLLYKKGLSDDAFGQVLYGAATPHHALGISIGYYNGGDVELFDGVSARTVTAQKDLMAGLSYARSVGGFKAGVSGKYLSSELAESRKASTMAVDAGVQIFLGRKYTVGGALQNFGKRLQYIRHEHALPRVARIGVTRQIGKRSNPALLLLDAPYDINEEKLRPALGLEIGLAPLTLRAGYQTGYAAKGFSAGIGFAFQSMEIGYAFGLASQFNDLHRVSLTYQFRDSGGRP